MSSMESGNPEWICKNRQLFAVFEKLSTFCSLRRRQQTVTSQTIVRDKFCSFRKTVNFLQFAKNCQLFAVCEKLSTFCSLRKTVDFLQFAKNCQLFAVFEKLSTFCSLRKTGGILQFAKNCQLKTTADCHRTHYKAWRILELNFISYHVLKPPTSCGIRDGLWGRRD